MWSYQEIEDANPNHEVTRGDGWLAVNGRVYVWRQTLVESGYVVAEFKSAKDFGIMLSDMGRGTNMYHTGDKVVICTTTPGQPTHRHSTWEKLAKAVNPFGLYFRVS